MGIAQKFEISLIEIINALELVSPQIIAVNRYPVARLILCQSDIAAEHCSLGYAEFSGKARKARTNFFESEHLDQRCPVIIQLEFDLWHPLHMLSGRNSFKSIRPVSPL